MQHAARLGPARAHEVRPLRGVEELAVEADPLHLLVGHGLDHHDVGGGAQPAQVDPGQLALLAGPHLARHVEDAGPPVLPARRVLTGELRRVEAVDRQRGVAGLLQLEHRAHGEDVDQAAVTPRLPVELHRRDEQREGDRHADGPGHAQVRVGARADVLETVPLHAPHGRVGRDRQLTERHVPQQAAVGRLDALPPDDAREAAPGRGHQRTQLAPVDVDVVLGPEGEDELGHLGGRDAGGHGEPEEGRPRAQGDHGRPDPGLLEGARRPHDRGEGTAAPGRHEGEALAVEPVGPEGLRGRERPQLDRPGPLSRQGERGAARVAQQARVLADAADPLAGGGDHVEVLAEPEHVEAGAQHGTTSLW